MRLSILSYNKICFKNYISGSVRSVAAIALENYSSAGLLWTLVSKRHWVKIYRSIETSCRRKLDHLNDRMCIYIDELALQRKLSLVMLTEVMGICLGSTNIFEMSNDQLIDAWSMLDRCRKRRFIAEQYFAYFITGLYELIRQRPFLLGLFLRIQWEKWLINLISNSDFYEFKDL